MFDAKENIKVQDFQHSPTLKLMRNASKTTMNCHFGGRACIYKTDPCELHSSEEMGRCMCSAKRYTEKLGKENGRNQKVNGRTQRERRKQQCVKHDGGGKEWWQCSCWKIYGNT